MIDQLHELRQTIQRIGMISHAPTRNYDGRTRRSTDEDIGGKKPPGTDREYKPRRPKTPLIDTDPQSVKAWRDYEDELEAWEACYQRKTVDYFLRRLDGCYTPQAVETLLREARATLEAWQRTPIPLGQEPEYGSPQWKRYIAESSEDAGTLASRYWNPRTGRQITRQYIHKIRKQYRVSA